MSNTSKAIKYHVSEKEFLEEILKTVGKKSDKVGKFQVDLTDYGLMLKLEREKWIDVYFVNKNSRLYMPTLKASQDFKLIDLKENEKI